MVDKSRLLAIKELSFTEKTDEQFEAYIIDLFFYCDTLPSHKETLLAVLNAKDYTTFLEFLGNLREFLLNIQAVGFADICQTKIDELSAVLNLNPAVAMATVNHEKLVEDVKDLFAALDIDILVAGHIKDYTKDAPEAEVPDGPKIVGRAIRIMAVDDTQFFLQMIRTYLRDTPYDLTCVESGKEAFTSLAKTAVPPDLFIIDVDMPEMGGHELAGVIRKVGIHSPIIFLTNLASRDCVIEAIKAGGSDLFIKSGSKDQFLEKINKLFNVSFL
jgi:CheY-like chemotaxis protein